MKKYFIPVLIFIGFVGLYLGYARSFDNNYLFLPVWDVEHYLSISEIGYESFPCVEGVHFPAGEICGNVGWYPGWPLVVKALRPLFGGSSPAAFIGLAFIFTLAAFLLFFKMMIDRYDIGCAVPALLALALGPASFYLITGFPYAMLAFLFLLYLFLLERNSQPLRNTALFLVALLLSLTYPTGILIALVPVVRYLRLNRPIKPLLKDYRHWLKLAGYVAPFVLGPLLLWSYFYFKFDDFFLQLHFQAKYQRTWSFPLWVMVKSLFTAPLFGPENLTQIWFGLIFIVFARYRVAAELWVLALVLFFFSPATGTMMSLYRHYIIILPAYIILGTAERPLWLRLAVIAAGLIISLGVMFPAFMHYRLI